MSDVPARLAVRRKREPYQMGHLALANPFDGAAGRHEHRGV